MKIKRKVNNFGEITCFWDHTITQNNGNYYIEPVKLRVLEIVIGKFHFVNLACRVKKGKREKLDALPGKYHVIPLYHDHFPSNNIKQVFMIFRLAFPIWQQVRKSEMVYCRHQGFPIFQVSSFLAVICRKKLIITIGGNSKKSFLFRDGRDVKPGHVNRIKAAIFFNCDRWIVKKADLALISGNRLNTELGNFGHCFSSDSFEFRDIFYRNDTCQSEIIRWVFTGTLSLEKGIDVILKALSIFNGTAPLHMLTLVVKSQKLPQWFITSMTELDVKERVEICANVPFGPELFKIYRKSDIFVFPSLHEGMPKSPMEALSQGLPVVCTPTGGDEYIENEKNGLFVRPDDPVELANAVKRLVSDQRLRRQLILNGYKTARENTFERQKERVARIIHETLFSSVT